MEVIRMRGEGYCGKCQGYKLLVLGILILVNFYWLKWDWWLFVGAVFVLKGLLMTWKPSCPCPKEDKKK